MAGLSLRTGINGVNPSPPANYSPNGVPSVMAAAFGPGATVPVESPKGDLRPGTPVGLSVWVGIGAVVALVLVRQSLPN